VLAALPDTTILQFDDTGLRETRWETKSRVRMVGSSVPETFDRVSFVLDYIAAAQRARNSQTSADLNDLRRFLAPEVVIKMASAWTDTPWRVVSTSADQLLQRFTDPINRGTSLTTETINAVAAGDDVLVEQLSTVTRDDAQFTSIVCHIFSFDGERIGEIRAYRNDKGIPAG
jgi:ketosteroid isomerase-like protein